MASQDNKQPGTNEFTGLLAVLVLFFSAVWVQYAPLTTSRPQPAEIPEISHTGVKARLWQDPFTAVQRERAKPETKLHEGCDKTKFPGDVLQKLTDENKPKEVTTVALGVMIQEASWESVEELQGRRQRYAVLAALNHLGYVPDDAEKLQCLEIAASAKTQNLLLIPYELFTKTAPDAKKTQVALFWLNEPAFNHEPLRLIRTLFGSATSGSAAPDVGTIRILGPWASGTVKDLVAEAQKPDQTAATETSSLQSLNRLMFFSSSATAADEFLLPADHRHQALPEFLASLDSQDGTESRAIYFERVTSTDDKVVRALVKELARRGLHKNRLKANRAYIALISEWDTLYAQTLPQTFKRELDVQEQCKNNGNGCPILLFSYLRGLDGVLPGKAEANADRQRKNTKESEKSAATIERPEGDSQIDYLRRLTNRLADRERLLRNQGKELSAIGVFGNDVYDKLLVLEALRLRFPDKLLFTTDLDAAYLHPDEFKSATRNLIVASAFGLTLNPYLQGGIPPFRDTYQTGTYLAAQVALSMDQFGGSIEKPVPRIEVHNKIAEWFSTQGPRVFEIGRTRAISLNDPAEGQFGSCTVAACQSVHPASEPEMGKLSGYRAKLFHLIKVHAGVLFLVALLWLLFCLLWCEARRMTRNTWRWLRFHPWAGFLGFIGLLAFIVLINYLAFFANGEELLSWVEGVSMWPAELIRLATLLLVIVLFWRSWRLIQWNDFVISKLFFPDTWRIAIVARAPAKQLLPAAIKDYWRELMRPNKFAPESPQEIWIEHIHPRSFSARLIRAVFPAVVFLVFGALVLSLVELPQRPYRGEVFGRLDFVILFSTLFALQVLIFFVAEASARCNRMAQQLKKVPNWPPATLAALESRHCSAAARATREADYDSIFDPLLDMHLIAERTDVVSELIYYPFFALALFIASRTPLFDNWHTPWQLALLFLVSFAIPVISALRLRSIAEDLRNIAIDKLSLCLLAQKGSDNPKLVGQLEEAIKQVKSLDKGAFRPFTQQPWLKALFLPLSSWSGFTILEFLITSNF
jgi:hypothetical protein